MSAALVWDIFCTVVDNHGDLGVCWRLSCQLRDAGQRVRLWVDDASALAWMAPGAAQGQEPGITVLAWEQATQAEFAQDLPPADVWIEAFGCDLPEVFVAREVARRSKPPVWINLEYLSAEAQVTRLHGLPSPVMSGPAKGWTKHFFYPGFGPGTGGLLREADLAARQQAFDRTAWRRLHAPALPAQALLLSLFCYEPAALPHLLQDLTGTPSHLLVAPGRPLKAVEQALATGISPPSWTAQPATSQLGFDHMLWACDVNFVRGEDSLVRALWAGQALVWQIYPQDDNAHHAKLEAFLDVLEAPESLRHFHRVWNGTAPGPLPKLGATTLAQWSACVKTARDKLWSHTSLLDQLIQHVQKQLSLGQPNSPQAQSRLGG